MWPGQCPSVLACVYCHDPGAWWPIMSGINKNNVCVPGDPDCTRTVPRPGILNMSTSPVTTLTVVRGQISDLDVVLNILVYDAERLLLN